MKERIVRGLICLGVFLAAFLLLVIRSLPVAYGKDRSQYAQADPERRNFFNSLTLNPGVREELRLPDYYKSCCDNGDTVKVEFRVDKKDGSDEWWYRWEGAWKRVPPDIVDKTRESPYGALLFVSIYDHQTPVCFIPPQGGI